MVDKDSSDASRPAPQRRRRSADPRRKNDPERTRRLILAAAKEEFGEHGFEAARVTRIADAAGVGHQLITYHFGGKRGLFEVLHDQWFQKNVEIASGSEPWVAVTREFAHFAHFAHSDEAWARALVREALEGSFPIGDERVARLIELVEQARIRQKSGAVREDIDVGALALAFFSASIAPAIFPAFARAFVGVDPSSADFAELYADQLGRIMAALAAPEGTVVPGREAGSDLEARAERASGEVVDPAPVHRPAGVRAAE